MSTITIEQAQQINPLIDSDGDAYKQNIVDLADRLDVVAGRLVGFSPILRLLADCTSAGPDVGNSLESLSGLSDYLSTEIGEIAQRMKEVAA